MGKGWSADSNRICAGELLEDAGFQSLYRYDEFRCAQSANNRTRRLWSHDEHKRGYAPTRMAHSWSFTSTSSPILAGRLPFESLSSSLAVGNSDLSVGRKKLPLFGDSLVKVSNAGESREDEAVALESPDQMERLMLGILCQDPESIYSRCLVQPWQCHS